VDCGIPYKPFTNSGKSNKDCDYILILLQISYQESEKKSLKNKTSKILQDSKYRF